MRKRASAGFVATTHNPTAMARTHRSFGVAMAQRGESQLVSAEPDGSGAAGGGGVIAGILLAPLQIRQE